MHDSRAIIRRQDIASHYRDKNMISKNGYTIHTVHTQSSTSHASCLVLPILNNLSQDLLSPPTITIRIERLLPIPSRLVNEAHMARIVPMILEVQPERLVLLDHPVVRERADEEERRERAEHREAAPDPEGAGVATRSVCAAEGFDHRRER